MRLIKFTISNFKGIVKTTINLADEVPGNIITLIGLNESGKTTILEALSHFVTEDQQTASLVGTVLEKSRIEDIVPKDKKAAFTGTISIKIDGVLDQEDVDKLAAFFSDKHKLTLNQISMDRRFYIERAYLFEDSTYKETKNFYNFFFPLRSSSTADGDFKLYDSTGDTRKVWVSRNRGGKIIYTSNSILSYFSIRLS